MGRLLPTNTKTKKKGNRASRHTLVLFRTAASHTSSASPFNAANATAVAAAPAQTVPTLTHAPFPAHPSWAAAIAVAADAPAQAGVPVGSITRAAVAVRYTCLSESFWHESMK